MMCACPTPKAKLVPPLTRECCLLAYTNATKPHFAAHQSLICWLIFYFYYYNSLGRKSKFRTNGGFTGHGLGDHLGARRGDAKSLRRFPRFDGVVKCFPPVVVGFVFVHLMIFLGCGLSCCQNQRVGRPLFAKHGCDLSALGVVEVVRCFGIWKARG